MCASVSTRRSQPVEHNRYLLCRPHPASDISPSIQQPWLLPSSDFWLFLSRRSIPTNWLCQLKRLQDMRTAGHGLTTNTHARMLFLRLLSHASAWLKARRSNSMLSQVDRLLGASPCMDVRIHLCKESSADAVAGQVVLASDTQLDIATVAIKLSGSATSRVHSGRLTESHQVCLFFLLAEK